MKIGHQHRRPSTTTFPIIGKLRDWYQVGKMYAGIIYDSPSHPKEKQVFTEYIKGDKKDCGEYYLIETYRGAQFILMKNEHHKVKKDVDL